MAEQDRTPDEAKPLKEFTITLPAPDGSVEAIAYLQENEDAAQPPSLLKISRNTVETQPSDQNPASHPSETHVIISTGSGHQKALPFFTSVLSPVLDVLYPQGPDSYHKHITTSERSILGFARDVFFPLANSGKELRIILLSGDGGIVDLVNGFSTQKVSQSYIAPKIVLIPMGTANALYHSSQPTSKFTSPSQPNTWGLTTLSSTLSRPLPTFTAAFSQNSHLLVDEARRTEALPQSSSGNGESILHGAVVFSWCMHASLVADSDSAQYRRYGIDRFKMAAKAALYPEDGSMPHAYSGSISTLNTDGNWTQLPEKQHLYTLVTLVSNLEAMFQISPASKSLDGSLHLVHFGPTTGDEAMRIMGLAYQGGKHVEDDKVRYEAVEGVRVVFGERDERWRRICVDGKIVVVEEGGWVEVRKGGGGRVELVVGE